MIDGLIRWSLHNRTLVLVGALAFTAVGVYTALRMPIDVFPDLTAPTVTVITEAHGMVPIQVETQVTFPIETALNGASGVRRVRSATAVGISVVWIEFEWGQDIYTARQIVSEKLTAVANDLPPEIARPVLAPISSIMGEVMFAGLTSDRHSTIELRTAAETTIRRRLLSVPGVAQVTPTGGDVKQYQVILSPARLLTYDISLGQVAEALSDSNRNITAGIMVEGGSEYLVTGVGRIYDLEDIAKTVVATVDGVPTRVGQLGEVRIGPALKRGEGSVNAQPAVVLGIQKQPNANTLRLTEDIDRILDEIQAKLPQGMKIDKHIFRQADFIDVAVSNVEEALRDGAILVVVVIFLFLANFRASFITLTAIPLSLLATVLTLKYFGATINTMTLGGMTIAIGALVDDAVIGVENIFRRLRENNMLPKEQRRPTLRVVYEACVEIRNSIVFATLIIVLVFIPIFFLSGVEGRLLQPLGVAYVVSLFASLIVALTVTPMLCFLLLPASKSLQKSLEPWLVRALKALYAPFLRAALRYPWPFILPAVLLFGLSIFATTFFGQSFLPEFNEGTLTVTAVTMPGTALEESDALGRVVERTMLNHPEVVAVARRTGRAELDEHAQGVEAAEMEVSLRMGERGKAEFLAALRNDFTLIPGTNVTVGQPISHRIDHMLSGTRANVAIKIFGEDLYKLRELAENARKAIESVPGVVDLSVPQQVDVPVLEVKIDRDAMARFGLTILDVTEALEAGFQGIRVSRVLEGAIAFDLVVRVAKEEDWDPATIGDLPLDTPGGTKIPLKRVARIVKSAGPNIITREQVARKIVVQYNVAGRDIGSVVEDSRRLVDPIVAVEPGYYVEYGGQFQSASESRRILGLLGIVVILGVGLLLQLAFRSTRDAALVMVNLPLALIGGVVGVFISGGVLSIASLVGFITVFGIATRNGIMLVSHIRNLQSNEGVSDLGQAIFRGAMERLAPILMTALATGLALVPLAISGDKPGNEIQKPMAIVILFGLLTSMFLNMIIVPALYQRFGRAVSITAKGGDPNA